MEPPRSNSSTGLAPRSRRSRTNLSGLRLAPLSKKYTEPPKEATRPKSPHEQESDSAFIRSHPSYIQGKSAPTSPGILSRSSSRTYLQGGLSRRGSLYDNDGMEQVGYEYAGGTPEDGLRLKRRDLADGMPKAQSDAALLAQRTRLAEKERKARAQKIQRHGRKSTGTTTPILRRKQKAAEDDWFTRTGATANAILQESKGQSWLASRPSATTLTNLQDTTDEEDEGYEEMAALSSHPRRYVPDGDLSPVSTRASRWGSRYGSRAGSRRTSRRGSFSMTAGSRTPLATAGTDGPAEYFGSEAIDQIGPHFVDEDEDDSQDDAAVVSFIQNRSFGLGGIVDRVMNFNIFKVEEREETTEDETDHLSETEEQAKARREAENRRRREEKERLVNRSNAQSGEEGDVQGEAGWSDAAWLLSVASKAIF